MKIITLNVNGIRSAAQKGFFEWMIQEDADVVCLQEVRAHMEILCDIKFRPPGYECHFIDAQKRGYSGVGMYTKKKPDAVISGLGWPTADNEGRYIQCDFGDLSVASIYMPSGTSGEGRQEVKYDFLDRYLSILKDQIKQKKHSIICGDINIAHKKIDIKNWRSNQKNSGFLPEERAWMDTLFDTVGYVDAFRVLNHEEDQYTWWSHRGRAYENNVGWRIDYQIITPELRQNIKKVSIYKGQKFSDHAPVIIEYDWML